ncbi:hypothetical protein [Sulfurimonas autotrophica]|uniref:Uncharacterized protein n=1 Tax=Sulfurimonas autotrophica (strain ATCC BAA-671 / DSM 16294 / JCM 11897 / OK10) TaxID=563040 RepID=E0UP85_SULAO|nr:hypothetical protein [Sulfurimonas autotrophica]ADN08549.1 conserved hypothetical protein [Sulfurimonas autotrophica DSM 16294]
MLHVMARIADWLIENEKKSALDCTIPDEVLDEWRETIEEREKSMKEHHLKGSEQYDMLLELDKKVKNLEAIRAKKCAQKEK